MLRLARLTSASLDLACHFFEKPLLGRSRRSWARKTAKRARRRPHLQLDYLEDRTLLAASFTGSISGSVWNDQNGDHLRNGGEPGLAGETVFLDINHDGMLDNTSTTVAATATNIQAAPGDLGSFGAKMSSLQVQNFPSKILSLSVNMDLANNGTSPVTVGIVSPTGLTVPNLPTLFTIQPGEHFVGTFDPQSNNAVTLAARPLASGTYRPQQYFTDPQAHIYDGNPNGTWGLVFFGDVSGLKLKNWSLTFTLAEPSTQTDASGNYIFSGLPDGAYQVAANLSTADVQTYPKPPVLSQTVQISNGQAATGVDFGIQPAPDLTTVAFNLSAPATGWGQNITVNYTLTNQGLGDAKPFDVALRLSSTGVIDNTGSLLQTLHFTSLASQTSTTGSVTIPLPASAPTGFDLPSDSYVGFVIDPTNAVAESNKNNNSNRGPGLDLSLLGVQANQAVASGAGAQQMPSVAVDPHNANHLVVAYMDYSLISTGYAGIGVAVSQDGGKTWTKNAVPLPANYNGGAATPTARFDDQGHVYVSFMAATFLGPNKPGITNPISSERQYGFQSNNGIFVARSDDGGNTFHTPVAVVSHLYTGSDVLFEISPDMAIDTAKTLPNGSPNANDGTLYVAWVRLYPAGQFPGVPGSTGGSDVMIAVSHDGGATWTLQLQTKPGVGLVSAIKDPDFGTNGTSSAGRGFVFFPHLSVGPEGDVYVSTFGAGDFTVYHSSDGEAPFRAPDRNNQLGIPFTAVLPTPSLFGDNFRTSSVRAIVADPAHPGRVYVAEANEVNNPVLGGVIDAGEIIFARSDDYGLTWQHLFSVDNTNSNLLSLAANQRDNFLPVLNDDNKGQYLGFASQLDNDIISGQALPSMSVDAQGNLVVIWYDTRRDPSGQRLDVFGTVSTDGGQTFRPNFRVTDTSFDPNAGSFMDANKTTNFYLGDLISVAAASNTGYAAWTDTRNGNQDIYFDRFTLSPALSAPIDRLGPNNTPQTATELGPVAAQQLLPGVTLAANDQDWYRLEAAATGELIVSATSASAGRTPQLQLTDANGQVLPSVVTNILDQAGAVIGEQLVYPSASGQTYLVHVTGDGQPDLSYSLAYGSLTADLGTLLDGSKSDTLAAGGQAVYRVVPAVTGSFAVDVTAASNVKGNLTVQILAADGRTVLASGPPAGVAAGQVAHLNLSVTQGEVLLVQVSGSDATTAGDFTLHFTNFDQYETPGNTTLFIPTRGVPASVAVADLNGDANPDLVVTSTDFSDPVSVLAGNGDGTFQAPQQFDVGPGLSGTLFAGYREPGITDLNGDGIPDLIIPNFRSADVSVLLGNGDGTFQPQRRFDALPSPDSLVTGDFNGDGKQDVIVLQNFPQLGGVSHFAVLLGRGDGTFEPPVTYATVFSQGAFPVRVGDFNGDGKDDLLIFSKNEPKAQLFLSNGDGTFRDMGTFDTGENTYDAKVIDLNGDGKLDLVTTSTNTGNVYVMLGNGDGTFQKPQAFTALAPRPGDNVGIFGLDVVDFGSTGTGSGPGPADHHLDIVVTAASRSGVGSAEVLFLPGLVDAGGNYAGFGPAQVLALVGKAGKIASGDFNKDGATDLVVTDQGGVRVIYGKPLTLAPNTSAKSVRDLGTVTHLVTLPQAILPGAEDAYYHLTVPTETVTGSGPEVLDFSANFQSTTGAGLQLEVLSADGTVLGSGQRFRVQAAQGAVLTLHVFGKTATDGTPGTGTYTLDVDVLPQVVSVEAQSALPGGPATSLVLTLQGDRLDPTTAQNPANYTVTWFGPDGQQGTSDDEIIPLLTTAGVQSVVYNAGANIHVASGLTYPTAVRQTITLLFDHPLPAGSYQITLSPNIQTAVFNTDEGGSLADNTTFGGHPFVSTVNQTIKNGSSLVVPNLVGTSSTGDPTAIGNGTAFLTQLQNDLGAMLDALLNARGDDPSITAALNNQILARFAASYNTGGTATHLPFAIFWLDPVSLDVQSSSGQKVSYNVPKNQVQTAATQTFVEVGGNVEVVVMVGLSGTFQLDVSDVPATARGGAVAFGADGTSQVVAFTDALRSGTSDFVLTIADTVTSIVTGPGSIVTGTTSTGTTDSTGTGTAVVSATTGSIGVPTGTTTNGPPAAVPTGTLSNNAPSASSTSSPAATTITIASVTTSVSASVSAAVQTQVSNLSQVATQALVSTLLVGLTTSSEGPGIASFATEGVTSGGTAASSAAVAASATGAISAVGTGKSTDLFGDMLNALDEVFLHWRESSEQVVSTGKLFTTGVQEVTDAAVSQVALVLEMVGAKPLTPALHPWQDVLFGLMQSGAAAAELFGKQVPIPRLNSNTPPVPEVPKAPKAPLPEEEESEETSLLRAQDSNDDLLGEVSAWDANAYWPALFLASGACHVWLRDTAEKMSSKKARLFSIR